MDKNLFLVGAGPMATEYAKVLLALDCRFKVIGRGAKSAEDFREKTGIEAYRGGLAPFLHDARAIAPIAIVAVGVSELFESAYCLAERGVKKILVEKPAALSISELEKLRLLADSKGAKIYVAYNRRYISSVRLCSAMIAEDGGLSSFHFEFTELKHRIESIPHPAYVKERWFLANSTHVADLAFHIGGMPAELDCFVGGAGELSWHPSASFFAGHGMTDKNIPFDYRADWNSPGRWSIEFMTRHRRFLLQPLESLRIQKMGSFSFEEVNTADRLDAEFKPGLHMQVSDFLSEKPEKLQSIEGQISMMKVFELMAAYGKEGK